MDAVSTPEPKPLPKPATTEDYYINVKNKSNLSFKEMWNRTDLSDIKLCCDKDEFRLHRFLLAACSPYFRHMFEKRPDSNQNIILKDVNGDDLRRVLLYMYHGSVMIKNDDIQGFCELLEMFLMPVPDDVAISDSESGVHFRNQMESESEPYSEEEEEEYEEEVEEEEEKERSVYDEFVKSVRDTLNNLSEENVETQSSTIANLAKMRRENTDTVISLILESVLQPKPNVTPNLFVLLVKRISIEVDATQFPEKAFKQYFRETLRLKTLKLFANREKNLSNRPESQSIPSNEIDGLNSLDKQVCLIDSIDCHCTPVRYQRLAHFIGHLFQLNFIDAVLIANLAKDSSQYKDDLFGTNHAERDCCNFQLPQVVDNICNDRWYRFVSPLENHLFWSRSQVVLGSADPYKFKHIAKEVMFQNETQSQRKQNRKARKERLAKKNQAASKANTEPTKQNQEGSKK